MVQVSIIVCPLNVTAVSAQTGDIPLSLKRALVNIWPEYDDPRLLILYEGEFMANEADFPQVVRFPVPSGLLQVNQAAGLTKDAQYLRQPWEIIHQPDGTGLLSYTLPIPTFFLEYYYPGIEGQGNRSERHIAYTYRSLYPVETLEFAIQVPLRSRGFRLSPVATMVTNDADGFTYHHLTYRDVQPGQEIGIDVRYTKDDSRPSIQRQASAGTSATATGQSARARIGYYLLALGVVSLAAAGGYYVWDRRRSPAMTRSNGPSRRSGGRAQTAHTATKQGARRKPERQPLSYCTRCSRQIVSVVRAARPAG